MAEGKAPRGSSAIEAVGVVLMILGAGALTMGGALIHPALGFAAAGVLLVLAGVALAYLAALRSGGESA